jgi:hypothetical protein
MQPVIQRSGLTTWAFNKAMAAARKLSPSAVLAAPVNGVAAALTTALTGANNDMVFTAKVKGTVGNAISVAYIDPGEETATESVVVTGSDIVVTLRSVSSVLSTAAQVKAAIEASAAAAALVTVAAAASDTLATAVIAMAADDLIGGVDGTEGVAWEQRAYNGYLYINASDAPATTSTANWRKIQLAAL